LAWSHDRGRPEASFDDNGGRRRPERPNHRPILLQVKGETPRRPEKQKKPVNKASSTQPKLIFTA
jgi:hypothetical protein